MRSKKKFKKVVKRDYNIFRMLLCFVILPFMFISNVLFALNENYWSYLTFFSTIIISIFMYIFEVEKEVYWEELRD